VNLREATIRPPSTNSEAEELGSIWAAKITEESGEVKSSRSLVALCANAQVEVRARHADRIGPNAILLPSPEGGFVVSVRLGSDTARRTDLAPRQRYLVAHELAHTLFYDKSQRPPVRIEPPGSHEERFCDAFAEKLLGLRPWPMLTGPVDEEQCRSDPDWMKPVATSTKVRGPRRPRRTSVLGVGCDVGGTSLARVRETGRART
jgi:hypothetical protein